MITLTNFSNGEIAVVDCSGAEIKLAREQANRLVMAARMLSVKEFSEKLLNLVPQETIANKLLQQFEVKTASEKWNIKEKFARLHTLAKDYTPQSTIQIIEVVSFL